MSADTATKNGPRAAVTASIVSGNGSSSGAYPMFEARSITPAGALLVGALFLEVNEEFTVELTLADGSVRATARVARLERAEPGMHVTFSGLSDSDRAALEKCSNG